MRVLVGQKWKRPNGAIYEIMWGKETTCGKMFKARFVSAPEGVIVRKSASFPEDFIRFTMELQSEDSDIRNAVQR